MKRHILRDEILEIDNIFTLKWVIKMIIRIALIAFGLYLIYEYIPPLIYKAILDAGNAFGLGAAALFILSGVFFNPIVGFIKNLWQGKGGKAIIIAVCVFAVAFVGVFVPTLISVMHFSEYNAKDETTVIILGCKVNGTQPSYALWNRTDNAVKYLEEHPDAVAILSGGQGRDEGISEAAAMQGIFEEAGIDKSRYFIEDKSTSTDENMAYSKRIIEENGLSKRVVISTHDYHQKRAAMIAKKNGLDPVSLPAPSVRWSKATFFTREVFGVWVQWIKN
jgi:uncharacterized SAM-binding protein YcdF (DUF218 family)